MAHGIANVIVLYARDIVVGTQRNDLTAGDTLVMGNKMVGSYLGSQTEHRHTAVPQDL